MNENAIEWLFQSVIEAKKVFVQTNKINSFRHPLGGGGAGGGQ
jgi:hypothetical protein